MDPFAESWLLQVPPSLTTTRSQLLPKSLWDSHIPPGPCIHFRVSEVALSPPWLQAWVARWGNRG